MKDCNFITIEGGTYEGIKKALKQWIDLYSDSIDKECSISLYKNGIEKYLILVDDHFENEHFCFLLNYLKYPEKISYYIKISGFLTVSDLKIFPDLKPGTRIQIYIPDFDRDYDYVYAVTKDNQTYKFDFGGNTTKEKLVNTFQNIEFDFTDLTNPETFTVSKRTKYLEKPDAKKISKRFNIILLISILLFSLTNFLVKDSHNFSLSSFMLGYGVSLWFFIDYKMLQLDSFYVKSLFISLLVAAYGYLLHPDSGDHHDKILTVSSIMPLLFLVAQRIYRFIFMTVMKREPVVDKPAPSFVDGVYMAALIITTLLMPLLIIRD